MDDRRELLPALPRTPSEHSRPALVAHRGASRHAPENTLAALTLARDQGADAVEFDVRQTRDGAFVLLHDTSLRRTTGIDRDLATVPLSDVLDLDAGEWFGNGFRGERIPLLEHALELLGPVPALIEVKSLQHPQALHAARLHSLLGTSSVTLQSFDTQILTALHSADPTRPYVRLVAAWHPFLPLVLGKRPFLGGIMSTCNFITGIALHHLTARPRAITRAHALGLRVLGWTVNTPRAARHLAHRGVDGLICDDIPATRAALSNSAALAP